jgi:hypothetical protein
VAVAVPLAALTALRVLDHAADRTRPASDYPYPAAEPPDTLPAEPGAEPVAVGSAVTTQSEEVVTAGSATESGITDSDRTQGDRFLPEGDDNPDARSLPAPVR